MGCAGSTEAAQPSANKRSTSTHPISTTSITSIQTTDGLLEGSSKGTHFDDVYILGEKLGIGSFSIVKEGRNRETDESHAIKIIVKDELSREDEIGLKDEIDVLKSLDHKHIIRLFDVFAEQDHYYIVTEKMIGGNLFDRIVQKECYNEKEARDTCEILFQAIGYCHQKKIAHRDLKPENLLLTNESDDSIIKLADFGFAKKITGPKTLTTRCGTAEYLAAEVVEGKPYDTQADMWSIGVIVYLLLGGYQPFMEKNERALFKKIRKGEYQFHDEYWGEVSMDAKDLIRNLLVVDPDKRYTSENALECDWIRADSDALLTMDLSRSLDALKLFNAKRKFRAAVSTVVAANRLKSLGLGGGLEQIMEEEN